MKALDKKERSELKKLTRKIRTQKATLREVLRAIDLTNRDHAEVNWDKEAQKSGYYDDEHYRSEQQAAYSDGQL